MIIRKRQEGRRSVHGRSLTSHQPESSAIVTSTSSFSRRGRSLWQGRRARREHQSGESGAWRVLRCSGQPLATRGDPENAPFLHTVGPQRGSAESSTTEDSQARFRRSQRLPPPETGFSAASHGARAAVSAPLRPSSHRHRQPAPAEGVPRAEIAERDRATGAHLEKMSDALREYESKRNPSDSTCPPTKGNQASPQLPTITDDEPASPNLPTQP